MNDADKAAIRAIHARIPLAGNLPGGWMEAYRQDVGALLAALDEAERERGALARRPVSVDAAADSTSNQARLCFVRFGELPPDGRSWNCLSEVPEVGVSVYEAVLRGSSVRILLPSLTESACVSLSGVLRRALYEVEGTPLDVGGDGEPVLANCTIVRTIQDSTDWRTTPVALRKGEP